MGKYESYIPSIYDWLGDIPNHWKEKSIRGITKISSERLGGKNLPLLSVYREYGVILKNSRDDNHNVESNDLSNYKVVHENDLVLNKMKMWQGSLGISKYDGIVSPAYIVCKIIDESINVDFLHFLLRTANYKTYYNQYSYGVRIGQWDMHYDDFKNMRIYIPSRAEQDQIVRFLDWKVSEINKLIRIKKKYILNIKDYEKKLLNDKVLHGLHNEKKKFSGNKLIGDIPDTWNILCLGRFCFFQNGISESSDFFTSGTPFVGYGDVYRHIELPINVSGTAKASKKQQELFSVQKDDIFFTRTSENIEEIGMAAVCSHTIDKAIFSGFLIRCRQKEKYVISDYMKYYLQIPAVRNHFSANVNIVIRASLNQNLLKTLPVVIPPENEQKEIASYLDSKHRNFTKLIEVMLKEINELKELKNTIISDVVTGKIDVRSVAIPEYEHIDDAADAAGGEESAEELADAEEMEA